MNGRRLCTKIGCLCMTVLLTFGIVLCGNGNVIAEKNVDTRVEMILSKMTLREKICQMLFVTPESIA